MSIEIKTDNREELRQAFDEVIAKGQQTMLTLSFNGDIYSLCINPLPVCNDPDCLTCLTAPDEAESLATDSVSGLPLDGEQPLPENR